MRVGTLYNPFSGKMRDAHVGFSWTTLLFGCFVPFARSDLKWLLIMFVLAVATCGLSWLVFPFIYNRYYTNDLLNNGYQATDSIVAETLSRHLGRLTPLFKGDRRVV